MRETSAASTQKYQEDPVSETGWHVVMSTGGREEGFCFSDSRMTAGVVVGRSQSCDVVVEDPSLSRRHCRVFLLEGRPHVEVIDAKNGVFVDGTRLAPGERRQLEEDSRLRFGSVGVYLKRSAPEAAFDGTLLVDEESLELGFRSKDTGGGGVQIGGAAASAPGISWDRVQARSSGEKPAGKGKRRSLVATVAALVVTGLLVGGYFVLPLLRGSGDPPGEGLGAEPQVPGLPSAPRPVAASLTTAPTVSQSAKTLAGEPVLTKAKAADTEPKAVGDVNFGRFVALVIGNNEYTFVPKLANAVHDARAVAGVLSKQYGFEVTMIIDGTRADIVTALDRLRGKLAEGDNLLIFYAGHGHYDKVTDRGYWLPVDAKASTRANWISNADVTDSLRAMQARHIIVVADSCYSGTMTRAGDIALPSASLVEKINGLRSRNVLASGGIEQVVDGGGKKKHSIFTSAFLDALVNNRSVIDGTTLYNEVRNPVRLNADQMPTYSDIRNANHEVGGDFLFVRR
ncbi:MAG: caspase family protein [Alphaproteobacteria bacterium]